MGSEPGLNPAPVMLMPPARLPEMIFRAAAVVPPIVLRLAPAWMFTPTLLGRATLPDASVPIRLPATRLLAEGGKEISTPSAFPEMTLPAPAVVPPTVL